MTTNEPESTRTSASSSDHLYDLAGAAKRLRISERTFETLVAEGLIPVVRVRPRMRRFSENDIAAYQRRVTRYVG